jgi:DNA-directed RNA polymerase specialized sigma subunit, sigma54 homolog
MLNQNLSQKMLQKLSPQQIQLMKLLQIPTANLEQRIKEEIEANPALEEGDSEWNDDNEADSYQKDDDTDYDISDSEENIGEDDFDDALTTNEDLVSLSEGRDDGIIDDYVQDYIEDDVASYKLSGEFQPEEEKTIPISVENSFHESLTEQLGLLKLEEREHIIAQQIIGSIDDDGYLRREPQAIADDLVFSMNITTDEDEITRVLRLVQRLDPPGVGARNLQESLILQMERR